MIKILAVFPFFLLGTGPVLAEDLGADFKDACGVFEEALSLNDEPEVMAKYVRDNLPYRVKSDEVIEAYEALFLVDPHKRYKLFKEIAESNMGESWDCPAFKVFVE